MRGVLHGVDANPVGACCGSPSRYAPRHRDRASEVGPLPYLRGRSHGYAGSHRSPSELLGALPVAAGILEIGGIRMIVTLAAKRIGGGESVQLGEGDPSRGGGAFERSWPLSQILIG